MELSLIACLLLGLAIGFSGGFLGIGGGVLMVPALTEIFGVPQKRAAGITLCVLALPVAMPGAWQYLRQRLIGRDDLLLALCIAGAFAVGTFLGGRAQAQVSVKTLRMGFAFVLIFLAFRIIFKSDSAFNNAVVGIGSLVISWLIYVALRGLGRRYAAPPSLADQIMKQSEKEVKDEDIEYYI